MNPLVLGSLVSGALVGAGIYGLTVRYLITDRVSIKEALGLDRSIAGMSLREQEAAAAFGIGAALPSRRQRWAKNMEERLAGWRVITPDTDLELIEWSRGRFLLVRVALTALAVVAGPVLWGTTALLGLGVGYAVPQGFSIFLALLVWYGFGVWVKGKAAARRLEMREALVSYLTLLALYKAAGEAMVSALALAAESSDAWTFRRIDARLGAVARAGTGWSPEAGLRRLGEELGIPELGEVAEIAASASLEGAGVFTTLLARADGLRDQMKSSAEAEAAARAVQLGIPKALLVAIAVAFLVYPLINQINGI